MTNEAATTASVSQCLSGYVCVVYRGKYQSSDIFSRRIRGVLVTICDDKMVRELYFLETARTPHTFLQVVERSQIAIFDQKLLTDGQV